MTRSTEEKAKFLNEHVWYEIDMLAAAGTGAHDTEERDDTFRNLFLEAAALHSRCLLDFLTNSGTRPDDAHAENFAPFSGSWQTDLAQLRSRTNKEIAHLTWSRKAPGDRTKEWPRGLVQDILSEAEKFWADACAHIPGVREFPERAAIFLRRAPKASTFPMGSTASVTASGPVLTIEESAGARKRQL